MARNSTASTASGMSPFGVPKRGRRKSSLANKGRSAQGRAGKDRQSTAGNIFCIPESEDIPIDTEKKIDIKKDDLYKKVLKEGRSQSLFWNIVKSRTWQSCKYSDIAQNGYLSGGWMTRFYVLFKSISIISGHWVGNNERLCPIKYPVCDWKISGDTRSVVEPGTAKSIGKRLTYQGTGLFYTHRARSAMTFSQRLISSVATLCAGSRCAVGSASDSRVRGPGFDNRSGHILSFLLPLIEEGQLSVTGESMCTKYWWTA